MLWFWLMIAIPFIVGGFGMLIYRLVELLVGLCAITDYWKVFCAMNDYCEQYGNGIFPSSQISGQTHTKND